MVSETSRPTRPATAAPRIFALPACPYLRVVASVALRRTDGAALLLLETEPKVVVETTGYDAAQGAA